MRRAYGYEIRTGSARTLCLLRFVDFRLQYYAAKMLSEVARKHDGKLTVRRLTPFSILAYKVKCSLGLFDFVN